MPLKSSVSRLFGERFQKVVKPLMLRTYQKNLLQIRAIPMKTATEIRINGFQKLSPSLLLSHPARAPEATEISIVMIKLDVFTVLLWSIHTRMCIVKA